MHFVIPLVCAVVCALVADSKGRSAVGWFLIGLFLPIIGLVLCLVVTDIKRIDDRHLRLQTENRRLRERVRKDRQVSDHRHQETVARLGVHDRALGVDTTERVAEPAPIVHIAPPAVPAAALPNPLFDHEWYFVRQGERHGPVQFEALREAFDNGELQPETLVWCALMEDWTPLRDHRELQEALLA